MIRRLNNENIASYIENFESETEIMLIQELVIGGELIARLKHVKKFSERDAALCIKSILETLVSLDEQGIIHRDLKLENILMKEKKCNYKIKLIDFGLACFTDNINTFRLCGTPGYMAPEVLRDKDYDTQVDVFSAGVILFAL